MTELSIARVYDYALDIHNNFAVDREATIVRSKTLPAAQLQDAARRRQRFLFVAFAIWRLPASDQSLDLGLGLPTENTGQVAQRYERTVRAGPHSRYLVCGTLRKRVGRPK